MSMVGLLGLLVKAASVFGLLALTVRLLRRVDASRGVSRGRARGGQGRPGAGSAGRAPAVGNLGRLLGGGGRRRSTPVLDIVERKSLGRTSSLLLLRVQDQHWVVGVTDQAVSVLLEVDIPADEPDHTDEADAGTEAGADDKPTPPHNRVPAPWPWPTVFASLAGLPTAWQRRRTHREQIELPADFATELNLAEPSLDLVEPEPVSLDVGDDR